MKALLLTLLFYVFIGISFLGFGTVVSSILGFKEQQDGTWDETIWLGFVVSLFLLQLIHLFLPLSAFVVLPCFLFGAVYGTRSIIRSYMHGPKRLSVSMVSIVIAATFVLAAMWVAFRSIRQAPDHYDSGLYHFTAIRWIFSYPIILGLGNLHSRLAFNSSFFLLVAAFDFHPIFNHGHQVANSMLFTLGLLTTARQTGALFHQPRSFLEEHPFRALASLLSLPLFAYLALSLDFASPLADTASMILQIVIFIFLADSIGQWMDGHHHQDFRVVLILCMALAATTIKLSNLGFAAAIAIFAAGYLFQDLTRFKKRFTHIVLPAILLVLVWCFRSFLLSGAPLYPSTIGYIPADWAIPKESVIGQVKSVYGWARQPRTDWRTVLADWSWLKPWLELRSIQFVRVAYPVQIACIMLAATLVIVFFSKRKYIGVSGWAILLPTVAGLVFWFLTAPALRFANALFFILSLSSCLLLLTALQAILKPKMYAVFICLIFILGNYHFLSYVFEKKWSIKPCATAGNWFVCMPTATWQPIPEIETSLHVTSSNLVVFTPIKGTQCWDAPLPCMPSVNPELSLREPSDLSSGFKLATP